MKFEKKVAFLMYPALCYFEVAMLLEFFALKGKAVTTFALDKEAMRSEEGILMLADKTLDEFEIDDFDCLLLTGIGGDPKDTIFCDEYMNFLAQFQNREDYTLASMSISPLLFGRAGLLKGRKYCVGMYEEMRETLPFMDFENIVRAPLVSDGNVITAMFSAYREFAIAVANRLGLFISEDAMMGIKHPILPEDYIYYATEQPE